MPEQLTYPSEDRVVRDCHNGLEMFASTDTGRQRSRNEDNFFVHSEKGLAVVADGMGGHADGNIASTTAVTTIGEMVGDDGWTPPTDREEMIDTMRGMIDEANSRIFGKNRGYFSLEGMGTTIVFLYVTERFVITACVGDSRIYRLRQNKLRQLTQDHSLLEELRRFNVFGGRQVQQFNINKNIITRALGMNSTVNSDLEVYPHKTGDLYLLCSDGLTDLVADEAIQQILVESPDLEEASARLTAIANENGGTDNITVVLVRKTGE